MGIKEKCMDQVRIVRPFVEAGGRDSPGRTRGASRAPGSRVLRHAGWRYYRSPGSSLERAAGRDTALERSE